jgi:hypothetical protein
MSPLNLFVGFPSIIVQAESTNTEVTLIDLLDPPYSRLQPYYIQASTTCRDPSVDHAVVAGVCDFVVRG